MAKELFRHHEAGRTDGQDFRINTRMSRKVLNSKISVDYVDWWKGEHVRFFEVKTSEKAYHYDCLFLI